MINLLPPPELVEGAIAASACVFFVLLYVRLVDRKLMASERPLGTKLTIKPTFRLFVAIAIATGITTAAMILKLGFAGTTSELWFALAVTLLVIFLACALAIPVFLTSIHIREDILTTQSPLGHRAVNLARLTSIRIDDRFQMVLTDHEGTVQFCHYVESKRALIEHIIERAPANRTWALKEFLRSSGDLNRRGRCGSF